MTSFSQANRIADAPFNTLEAMMWAVMAMRANGGQKEPPNVGMATDIKTVSRLLPYCDAMFRRSRVPIGAGKRPQQVQAADGVRVYSMPTKDQFLAHLKGLRATLSDEHIAGIREAYGDQVLGNVPARRSTHGK